MFQIQFRLYLHMFGAQLLLSVGQGQTRAQKKAGGPETIFLQVLQCFIKQCNLLRTLKKSQSNSVE